VSGRDERIHFAELQELEDMVGRLTLAALKLPAGVERRDSLDLIGNFRERIAALRRSESALALMRNLERTA
jgi:hypothetical protein